MKDVGGVLKMVISRPEVYDNLNGVAHSHLSTLDGRHVNGICLTLVVILRTTAILDLVRGRGRELVTDGIENGARTDEM